MKPKQKQNKSIWTNAFPDQAKALRPESSKAGGVKARSTPEKNRMEIYNAIKDLYLLFRPICEVCIFRGMGINDRKFAIEIHHEKSRDGWLLVDIRYWKSTCRHCHRWIHDNIEEARKLGLIAKKGDWNKLT